MPAEDGWPYPDGRAEVTDPRSELDDDLLLLRAPSPHLFEELDDLERQVITAHYGLNGRPARTMKQLHAELGLSRAELRDALGSGLEKLRARLCE